MAVDFKIKCLEPVIRHRDDDGNPLIMYHCGKCALCRDRKRRQWASRMECESLYNKSCFFISLTYEDSYLPKVAESDIMTLNKAHYHNFLKLLRKSLPFPIRFFGVGEYGKESGRPHYHFIIWCPVFINKSKFRSYVSKCWTKGFNTVKSGNVRRFYYIAKYVTKDTQAPLGAQKAFQSCSQKPPIGFRHFENNSNLYNDLSVNYFVSPTFRKSSLPRSFERLIKKNLSSQPRSTVLGLDVVRSRSLRYNGAQLMRQYVMDYNKIGPDQFVRQRDEIERRLSKKSYNINQI